MWAWDLFHLGAYAKRNFVSAVVVTPRLFAFCYGLRFAAATSTLNCALRMVWIAPDDRCAVGRAHENVALATLSLPLKEWMSSTKL